MQLRFFNEEIQIKTRSIPLVFSVAFLWVYSRKFFVFSLKKMSKNLLIKIYWLKSYIFLKCVDKWHYLHTNKIMTQKTNLPDHVLITSHTLLANPVIDSFSHKQAQEMKSEYLWELLGRKSVNDVMQDWLTTFSNPSTKKSYASGMSELAKLGIFNPDVSLKLFSLQNHSATVDAIKQVSNGWSEASKQQRAAAFISFTGFLNRQTEGIIKKALPAKDGEKRTFFRIRQHVKTHAFGDREEWTRFLSELEKINRRDYLIAKILLQGGKRLSEALSLTTDQIDYENGTITFRQKKTKGTEIYTVISYRHEILNELKKYIGSREGVVFVTTSGRSIRQNQIQRNFKKAGERCCFSFKVTPHVLRATAVTFLKQQGFSDSDIMKVTGHADSKMIRMYDKSSLSDNASKKINLI